MLSKPGLDCRFEMISFKDLCLLMYVLSLFKDNVWDVSDDSFSEFEDLVELIGLGS